MFCHGIEGEEEKEDNNDLDYKEDYNHEDNWDPEELVINLEEENNNDDDKNMEENENGYTASERAYMNVINTLEDDNSVEMVEEEEEKDERYYLRQKKALEKVAVTNNLTYK